MRIALGVGGGIAAYKAAELARILIGQGHEVQVVMTKSAQEFITPLTFATLTNRKTITELFSDASPEATLSSAVEHIRVAEENDLLVVAPATANLLAKFAHGLADDFLSTLYLAFTGQVVLAPAMNNHMWEHPATRANLDVLATRGHRIVSPGSGFLACGTIGPGRLADPQEIANAIEDLLHPLRDLAGETVLITAGPTQEPIDPVRYISNRSSGRMGYALAEAAASRGARVILISGPVHLETPSGVERLDVKTAAQMFEAVKSRVAEATVVIKCAAVADFRPAQPAGEKIKKSTAGLSVELEPTIDILAELGRKKGNWLLIGFAAETSNLQQEAKRKLETKNADMIVGNLVGGEGAGFESEENEVVLVTRSGATEVPRAPKPQIANRILTEAMKLRVTSAVTR